MNEERLNERFRAYARTRDTALRDELFEAYLPLGKSVARRFVGRGAELDDLEQVAGMALLKALERFDPERGYRFATYAVPTIAGDLRNHLRDRGSLIRLPREARQRLYDMQRAQERFERERLRAPSAAELAALMGVEPDELLMLLDLRDQTDAASLDAQIGEDTPLHSLVGGEDAGYERFEQRDWMRWVLDKVSDTERTLLTLRFKERLGQRETARRMGVSQMQVSRLERRVLGRLKAIETSAEAR